MKSFLDNKEDPIYLARTYIRGSYGIRDLEEAKEVLKLGAERGALFAFEDLAGIYEAEGRQTMFALCTRHDGGGDLLTLPAGDYLYAECTDETYRAVLGRLRAHAAEKFGAAAAFAVRIVKLTGILQWKYEAQIWLGDADSRERGANAAPLPSIILS